MTSCFLTGRWFLMSSKFPRWCRGQKDLSPVNTQGGRGGNYCYRTILSVHVTFTGHDLKVRADLIFNIHLIFIIHVLCPYFQLFIEIQRENTLCICSACVIQRVTCYDQLVLLIFTQFRTNKVLEPKTSSKTTFSIPHSRRYFIGGTPELEDLSYCGTPALVSDKDQVHLFQKF